MDIKVYYLSSCSTCKRIIAELALENAELIDIKKDPIPADVLDDIYKEQGSYEALFNKRAQLYRKEGWHEKNLEDLDYRKLILQHYTFLKRPVIAANGRYFVGNSKANVLAAKAFLEV